MFTHFSVMTNHSSVTRSWSASSEESDNEMGNDRGLVDVCSQTVSVLRLPTEHAHYNYDQVWSVKPRDNLLFTRLHGSACVRCL